jgi:lipopolysaccharide export system protein LptA
MLKLAWPRALRAVLVGILILVVTIILAYFVSHRRPPTIVPSKAADVPAKQVEKQEGIEHLEFRGERTIHVKAGSWHRGEDGRFYIEKNVEVRDLAKRGGREVYISGDMITYDKDWTEARLEGNAKIRYGDLLFESSGFDYRKAADVLSTEHGVVISSPKINGSASRMMYSFKDEIIRLEGAVSLQAKGASADDPPFVVKGEVLTYRRLERRGRGEGNVEFFLGESSGRAAAIDFRMTDDEKYLLDFSLRGEAQASLSEATGSGAGGPTVSRAREIRAEEMDGRAFLNMNKIHSIEARGGCSLNTHSSEGLPIKVRSAEMLMVFDRWGGLREYRAFSGASLVESGADGRVARTLSGESIVIEGPGDLLRIAAPAGGEALVDSADSEITGQEIHLAPRTEDIYASGSVKLLLKTRTKGRESVGFFSGEQPVMAVGENLSFANGLDRLILSEGARMWQGKQMLSGKEISVQRDTGELRGSGGVQAVFPRASKKEGGEEERLEVGGDSLTFSSKDHLLKYQTSCWLKTQDVSLTSDRIDVFLAGEGNAIRAIEANARVVIVSGFREGRGDKAIYDPDKETIDLTGHPSLTDKEKGVIEGDKLTFNLGDGRIHVENSGRERSVTVIKS